MPKMKTQKSVSKRIKMTKTGKALKRAAGQGHFNAREAGVTSMNKRRDLSLAKAAAKSIKKFLPYN